MRNTTEQNLPARLQVESPEKPITTPVLFIFNYFSMHVYLIKFSLSAWQKMLSYPLICHCLLHFLAKTCLFSVLFGCCVRSYPSSYPANYRCEWEFRLTDGHRGVIMLTHMELERNREWRGNCTEVDHVALKDKQGRER